MFTYYDERVSEDEYFNSPEPSDKDLVFFAQSLGIQLKIGSPILRVLKVTERISPNKRIRKKIEEALYDLELGNKIEDSIKDNFIELDELMISEIKPRHNYIENLSELGDIFQDYARRKIKNPNYISGQIIGRSIELLSFTQKMHYHLSNGKSVLEALKNTKINTTKDFERITNELPIMYETKGLTNPIYSNFREYFDYLYITMLDCGEAKKNSDRGLIEAFSLLATP